MRGLNKMLRKGERERCLFGKVSGGSPASQKSEPTKQRGYHLTILSR